MNEVKQYIPEPVKKSLLRPARSNLKKGINSYKKMFLPSNSPHFIILGAQKAGTSSLYYYLNQHPQIRPSLDTKEVGFFNRDIYFGKTFSEYQKQFSGLKRQLYFDATPEYLYHPGVAHKIAQYLPNVQLIIVLRDPVQRAFSAFSHYRSRFELEEEYCINVKNRPKREGNLLYEKLLKGRQKFPSFRECIEIELDMMKSGEGFEPALLRRGLYLEQLQAYWKYFDPSQILILGFKDLANNTFETLDAICRFLGVSRFDCDKINTESKNRGSYSEHMKEEDRVLLEEFFAEPNRQLFETIGPVNW